MEKNGTRFDGRKHDDLRPMEAKVGVLKNADGSAMFRLGNTYAIAGVYGPREVHPKHDENAGKAILRVRYNMAAFSTKERSRPGPSRRSQEISMVTQQALSSVVFLEEFPKAAIDVFIEIIEADASTRCVGLNAAALALADAGIPMKGLVSSRKTTDDRACCVTIDISWLLLLGPGRLRSFVEKAAMLYLTRSIAFPAFSSCFGWTSRVP